MSESRAPLGTFELMVLLGVLRRGDGAYATAVRDEIGDWTGRELSRGAVYATLDRLEDKGLLDSELGDPTPERGGRAKRYYRLSEAGLEAVRESRRTLRIAWGGLEELLDEA